MKKIFSLLIPAILIFNCSSLAYSDNIGVQPDISTSVSDAEVLWFEENEQQEIVNIIEQSPYDIIDMLENNGVLVVMGNSNATKSKLESFFNIPIRENDNMLTRSADTAPSGIDIANIYIQKNGRYATYTINTDSTDEENHKILIQEVIDSIREEQVQVQATSNSFTQNWVGEKNYIYTRQNRGKLSIRLDIYTVQNLNSYDHYIIKATVDGIPGKSIDGYEDFSGDNLNVSIFSLDNSLIDAYGPENPPSTGSLTIGVDLGVNFDLEDLPSIDAAIGLSWTQDISSVNLTADGNTKRATWDISLNSGSDDVKYTFKPGVNFMCPYTKSSIQIGMSAEYTLSKGLIFHENDSIEFDKTFTISSSSITDS